MVSAQLLAQTDRRLRELVRFLETRRWRPDGTERPFAGLNVIYAGDFWQLDPPDGGFLGSIPAEVRRNAWKHSPAPKVAHGQSLLWGGADRGVQGVTELEDGL